MTRKNALVRKSPEAAPPSGPLPDEDGSVVESLENCPGLACVTVSADGTIVSWNSAMEAILGWRADEMIGRSISERLPGALGTSGGPAPAEITLVAKDGRHASLRTWNHLVHGTDDTVHRVIVVVDDSEKKFLERALLEAAEREQRRIGQELHDHLCQHLLGAAFSAKALAGDLERDCSAHAPELHDLARLINDAVSQVRDISRGLHPVELDDAGLMSALQELATRVSHTVPCMFSCDPPVLIKDAANSLNAYRIAQEAVTNAMHATGARKISISLSAKKDTVFLTISDDGMKEGELTSNPQDITAKTLSYRARAMRGEITFDYAPGKGSRIACAFPRKP